MTFQEMYESVTSKNPDVPVSPTTSGNEPYPDAVEKATGGIKIPKELVEFFSE